MEIVYTPSSIANAYNNALHLEEFIRLQRFRGLYQKNGNKSYGGNWYDLLKDESSDKSVKLIISDLARNELKHDTAIEFTGFVTKKVNGNGTIDILLNFDQLLEVSTKKFSEDDFKKVELINSKISIGFRDLNSYIKEAIFNNQKPRVVVVHGQTAIIDNDIKTQMAEAVALYNFEWVTTTISSVKDILNTIDTYSFQPNDILVLTRGGGGISDMAVFDNIELCSYLINFKGVYLVTAIGHDVHQPLLEKLADKKFITPTAFGQYLKEHYNNTVEEFEKSKAKLVDDVTKHLKANYDKQIQNLEEQLKASQELSAKSLADKQEAYAKQVQNLQEQIKALTELNEKTLLEKEALTQEKINSLMLQIEKEKNHHEKVLADSQLNFEAQIKSYNERIAGLQQTSQHAELEKSKIHTQAIEGLQAEIERMKKAYEEQVHEAQRNNDDRLLNLNSQIATLLQQHEEKNKMIEQAKAMVEDYRKQVQSLKSTPTTQSGGGDSSIIIVVLVIVAILILIAIVSKS